MTDNFCFEWKTKNDFSNSTCRYLPKININIIETCTYMLIAALFIIGKIGEQVKFSSD